MSRKPALYSMQNLLSYDYASDRTELTIQRVMASALHKQLIEPYARDYVDVARFTAQAIERRDRTRSQLFQDLWVLFELGDLRDGYFVDFGACDGELLSNSCLLEREYGWSGLLAEPNRVFHDALAANRHAAIDHRCVAAESGRTVRFRATADPEFSAQADYALSDLHAERRSRGYEEYEVETVSLQRMLADHGAPPRIHYLSLDTEGSEYDILKGFDFGAYRIDLITVEHNWTRNRGRIHRLLSRHGYVRKFMGFSRWDDWYVRAPA